jgi:hypothetical protein
VSAPVTTNTPYVYEARITVVAVRRDGDELVPVDYPICDERIVTARQAPLADREIPAVVRHLATQAINHTKENHR